MTKEEAIEILKAHHMWTGEPQEMIDVRKENKALDMAIQALSQEPCDDAVSQNQSEVCSILDDECPYPHKHCWECSLHYQYELAKHELDKNVELPSVTHKSGKCELKALIDKHRMYRLADDELSEFERDVLELAESEE